MTFTYMSTPNYAQRRTQIYRPMTNQTKVIWMINRLLLNPVKARLLTSWWHFPDNIEKTKANKAQANCTRQFMKVPAREKPHSSEVYKLNNSFQDLCVNWSFLQIELHWSHVCQALTIQSPQLLIGLSSLVNRLQTLWEIWPGISSNKTPPPPPHQ